MKMNLTKMLMMMTMIMSATSALSSSSMLMTWMMMEINLMAFLPILTKSKSMKDQPMKYFIIQSLASSMMLMSMLMNSMTESPLSASIMLMSSLLMKMGLIPFHMWVPMIMKTMTWENCLIIMTIQKIIPTMLVSQLTSLKLMMLPICASMIFAPVMAIKQLSLKTIMAYSSISNSPWMIMALVNSKSLFLMFFSVYTLVSFLITKKFKEMNMIFMNQMNSKTKKKSMSIIINILSMSGMPPMMGFFPKWLILQSTLSFSTLIASSMISSAIMSTFIYMKMISPIMMISSSIKKDKKKNETKLENDITINVLGTMIQMMTSL
uniref:NADH-ubiquinone oxidoreductase chain 2 n=1 Tax=Ricania speculum TaxID=1902407 RepID=A0A1C9JBY1_9HEMI|nr:NADH dehydrogenase subunit 2 [Ricania speculum]AOP19357.1 NADH dehydrogenase subunit 2 [Ricania speculum]